MTYRWSWFAGAVCVALSLTSLACAATNELREARKTPVDTGTGTLEATRRALEGSWTLVSLEVVQAGGSRRQIKATGQLSYDAFGTMTIRGVIEDPALKNDLVLDYDGRIVIDTVRQQFHAADLESDRPVNARDIEPISPDKVRRYELSGDSFVVTYLDASGAPTAVARWRRSGSAAD